MDEWTDGQMNGWPDKWVDAWMDEQTDKQTDNKEVIPICQSAYARDTKISNRFSVKWFLVDNDTILKKRSH